MEFNTISKKRNNLLFVIIALVIVLALAAVAGFFFWQWQSLKNDPAIAAEQSTSRVLEKVGKIYALPKDEKPTVAQVQDKEKLKEQSFFDKSQNGDYLLMYTKAKLALLYREQTNQLINVGPISINSDQNNTQTQQSQSQADSTEQTQN